VKIPRDVNGPQAVRALKRLGFEFQRQTGSHTIMRRDHRIVPQHKPIKPGTLKGLIEQAGLTIEEFTAQL
jgi:predicted RNA binding protein YcfA (HicA-like mRNA interferase family)